MKLAVVADLHFRGKKLEDKKKAWAQAVDRMVQERVTHLFLAGDVFDTRNIGGREASMGTVYRAFVDPLGEKFQEVVSVLGNHELATGSQLSALEVLKGPGVKVIDRFGDVRDFDDAILAYIPWIPNNDGFRTDDMERWLLCIKKSFELKKGKMKIVIGHLSVKGAQLNSGISLVGSEFEVEQKQLDGLKADLVVLGHIHKRQQIGKKIHYVGALNQSNFGEEGNPSGFMIIDTKKQTHKFVEVEAPRYVTITSIDDPVHQDDYVKLRLKEKPENIEELLSNPNLTVEIVPEREALTRKVEGIEAGRSDEDLLDAYLVSRGKNEEERARIIKAAKALAGAIS